MVRDVTHACQPCQRRVEISNMQHTFHMRAHLSRWKEATTDESDSAHTTLKVTPLSPSKGEIVRMVTRTTVVYVAQTIPFHNTRSISQHEPKGNTSMSNVRFTTSQYIHTEDPR